jgi:hypothetical protein
VEDEDADVVDEMYGADDELSKVIESVVEDESDRLEYNTEDEDTGNVDDEDDETPDDPVVHVVSLLNVADGEDADEEPDGDSDDDSATVTESVVDEEAGEVGYNADDDETNVVEEYDDEMCGADEESWNVIDSVVDDESERVE